MDIETADTDTPTPPASSLYHLNSCGLGTSEIEAFTGYFERLAEAHQLFLSLLATKVVLPLFKNLSATYSIPQRAYIQLTASWWRNCSAALNGLSPSAQDWVNVVEYITLNHSLRFSTMLTWRHVLPARGLLRRALAWCPKCFEVMRTQGRTVYRPLLWSLELVSICIRHKCRLQEQCSFPDCNHKLSTLSPHSTVGFCPYCNRWLGKDWPEVTLEQQETDMWNSQVQTATWIGEMLTAAPSLPVIPRKEAINFGVKLALEKCTNGNISELARQLGMSKTTILELRDGTQLPQLGTVLRLCGVLETTPLKLLTETIEPGESIQCAPILVPSYVIGPMREFDEGYIGAKLQAVLKKTKSPPLKEIADQLGYDQSFLSTKLPELCNAISDRHLAFRQARKASRIQRLCRRVREEVVSLHTQGILPSKTRMSRIFHIAFMTEPAIVAAYQDAMRELGYEVE